MIVWLVAAAGVWLAAVCAICVVLTAVKRADTRLYAPLTMRLDLATGGVPVNDASGVVAPAISAIAVSVRESSLAARTTAIATGDRGEPSRRSADVDYASCRRAYPLYLGQEPVAQLHWRFGPDGAVGWYLSQRRGDWQQLPVGSDFKPGSGRAAPSSLWHQTTDRAATVSRALDAAVTVLDGPRRRPSRPLRPGHYEL